MDENSRLVEGQTISCPNCSKVVKKQLQTAVLNFHENSELVLSQNSDYSQRQAEFSENAESFSYYQNLEINFKDTNKSTQLVSNIVFLFCKNCSKKVLWSMEKLNSLRGVLPLPASRMSAKVLKYLNNANKLIEILPEVAISQLRIAVEALVGVESKNESETKNQITKLSNFKQVFGVRADLLGVRISSLKRSEYGEDGELYT